MKKMLLLAGLLLTAGFSISAQSVYHLSFKMPNGGNSITFKAFLVNNDDAKGIVRLKFNTAPANEEILVEMDILEEYTDINTNCYNSTVMYYKLQNAKNINGKNSATELPKYFCFKKDTISGLFEPFGISNTADKCKPEIIRFNTVDFIEQKNLTQEFVLTYFKKDDPFYRYLFVTNKSKALTVLEQNTKLILLVVADVNDRKIGFSCRSDMNNALAFFEKVKRALGIQFSYDTVAGNEFTKQNVERALNALNPSPQDIVVFYYTGHGFRKDKDTRPTPYIDLKSTGNNNMDNSMNMMDIFTTIKRKGARLNLVLSDCCNALPGSTNAMAAPPAATKGFGITWNNQNCRDLFLNPLPSSILATAASPGQLATSNDNLGGFFSYFFRSSLENNLGYFKNKVTWEQVFDEAKNRTKFKTDRTICALPNNPKNICYQIPYFEINPW